MKEFVLFLCLLFAGFNAQAFVINGDELPMGNGSLWAFADVDSSGHTNAVGIAFTEEALQGLPHDMTNFEFKLPSVLNIPPYDHMVVNWMPHGHEPIGIYNLPHFDFHFHFLPSAVQNAITCMGADRDVCLTMPDADEIPPFYVSTPEGTPTMGWHWLDRRSPELNGQKFTTTFIYGFYAGDMSFAEPMITREFLLSKPNFSQDLPRPARNAKPGIYPVSYKVEFDSMERVYYVTLVNAPCLEQGGKGCINN